MSVKPEAISTAAERAALEKDGLYSSGRKGFTKEFYDRYAELRTGQHRRVPRAEVKTPEAKTREGTPWLDPEKLTTPEMAAKAVDVLHRVINEKVARISKLKLQGDAYDDAMREVDIHRRGLQAAKDRLAELRSGERGGFSFRKKRQVNSTLPPQFERMFPTEPKLGRIGRMWKRWAEFGQGVKETKDWLFEYEHMLKDFPAAKDEMRLFQGQRHRIFATVADDIWNVIGGLDRKGFQGEMELFRRALVFGDMAARAKRGQPQPGGHAPEVYEHWHDKLVSRMTPAVKQAYRNHIELMRKELQGLVDRDMLPAELLKDRSIYYPHHVLDYAAASEFTPRMKRWLRKINPIAQPSVMEAKGSHRLINTNYVDLMLSHLTKVRIGNAMDDFARNVLGRADAWPKLTPAEKLTIRPDLMRHMMPVTIRGKVYRMFKYQPRQGLSSELGVTDRGLGEVIDSLMHHKEKYYLVPDKIAQRFNDFYTPEEVGRLSTDFRAFWTLWKRYWLNMLGIPFHVNNFIGDNVNLYREDPRALVTQLNVPRIAGAALRPPSTKMGKAVMDFAESTGLIKRPPEAFKRIIDQYQVLEGSGWFGGDIPEGVKQMRHLRRVGSPQEIPGPIEVLRRAAEGYERVAQLREAWPKIAKAWTDFQRIQRGGKVKTTSIDLRGLSPEAQLGKVAREFGTDYAATSEPFRKIVRGWAAPFFTWYHAQIRDWPRYVMKAPLDATIKFGVPLAAAWYWNNVIHGDVEERNPDYMKESMFHLNTGLQTPDGRDVVIQWQTGADVAAQLFQVNRIPRLLGDLRRGETTVGGMVKDLFTPHALVALGGDVMGDMNRLAARMMPLLGIVESINRNYDIMTHRTIVPEHLQGTTKGAGFALSWIMQQLIPPYAIHEQAMRRVFREGPDAIMGEPDAQYILDILTHGPFDLGRAVGVRKFDPTEEQLSRVREGVERAENKRREALAAIEEGFAKQAQGDSHALEKAFEIARNLGVALTAKDVQRRMSPKQNPRVYRDLFIRLYQEEKDPAKKEELRQQALLWQQAVRLRGLKQQPKSAVATYAREKAQANKRKEAIDRMLQGITPGMVR